MDASPDIWATGALGTIEGAAFLSVSDRMFQAIARQERWPRKYAGRKVLYPRALVSAYLAALPDVPPATVKTSAKRLAENRIAREGK